MFALTVCGRVVIVYVPSVAACEVQFMCVWRGTYSFIRQEDMDASVYVFHQHGCGDYM